MYRNGGDRGIAMRMGTATRTLLVATIAVFVLQIVIDIRTGGLFTMLFGLTCRSFRHGEPWQIVTYMFLHGGLWHLALNMLALAVLGGEIEKALGRARLVTLYLVCGVIGGLGWLLLSCREGGVCIGASGAVFGVIGAYAAMFPARRITLLLFFVLPLTLRASVLALLLAFGTVVSLITDNGDVAHAAHLAGGLAGYLYGRRQVSVRRAERAFSPLGTSFGSRSSVGNGGPPDPDEVNRVLDKVLREGMGNLTREDRDVLERASRLPPDE